MERGYERAADGCAGGRGERRAQRDPWNGWAVPIEVTFGDGDRRDGEVQTVKAGPLQWERGAERQLAGRR